MVIKLSAIFIFALIVDSLVLPALFNFRDSSLALLTALFPILYFGPQKQFIFSGFIFSFISELSRGLNFGTLVIFFLFTAIIMYLIQSFLDVKYAHNDTFNLGKSVFLAFASLVCFYIYSVFYRWGDTSMAYFNPVISLAIVLEALVLVFVFNIVFNKRSEANEAQI